MERQVRKINNRYLVYVKTKYGFYTIETIKDQMAFKSIKQLENIFNEYGMTINKYNEVVLLSN